MSNKLLKNANIAIFLQARIKASRLPGKIFKEMSGKSMLIHIVERVQQLKKYYNNFVVVVPKEDASKIRAHLFDYPDVGVFPGSMENVLDRFYQANKKYRADYIVRLTADNPLVSIKLLKKGLIKHIKSGADYSYEKDFPLGTGYEIINKKALNICHVNSKTKLEKEHVTPYMRQPGNLFKIYEYQAKGIYKNPDIRLTVDTESDYNLMLTIYFVLYNGKPIPLKKVLKEWFKRPVWQTFNTRVKQKPGW